MADLASIEELKARLDWTLDADEERIAAAALTDASNWARHYGQNWATAAVAPPLVNTLVLKAAQRYMNNPEGFIQSRAGDETLIWDDAHGANAGSVYFTPNEIALLRELGGQTSTLMTAPVTAWESRIVSRRRRGVNDLPAGFVPADYALENGVGDDFPFFADEVEPW